MPIMLENSKTKINSFESIKRIYCQDFIVYSSGNSVTYIWNGNTTVEEFDEGEDCISPKTFTPTKSGSYFLGWTDDPSNATALNSKIMGDEPITLYAIFSIGSAPGQLIKVPTVDPNDSKNKWQYMWSNTYFGGGTSTMISGHKRGDSFTPYYNPVFDMALYKGIKFIPLSTNRKIEWDVNYSNRHMYIKANIGGVITDTLFEVETYNSTNNYKIDNRTTKEFQVTFNETSGNTYLIWLLTSAYNSNGYINIDMSLWDVYLIPREVVG